MIELNKNKLIPGVDTAWGDIRGDISKQSDLMSMMSDYLTASSLKTINNQSIVGSGNIEIEASVPDYYATKAWVSEQGYLTSVPSGYATESWVSSQNFATESWVSSQSYLVSDDLSQYATRQWVTGRGYITSDALSGYATESWVSSQNFATQSWVSDQGYLTSETLPSDIATQSWVASQGYLTSTSLKTINEQSLVGEGDIEIGGLTPEQEAAIEPLEDTSNGVLYTRELKKYESHRLPVSMDQNSSYGSYLYNIDGDIYQMMWNSLFKMNPDNFNFELVGYFQGDKNSGAPLWSDHTGRMYNGVTKQLNLNTFEIDTVDLECSDYYSAWENNCDSIWKTETGIYNIGTSGVSKFDESLKKFVSYTVTVTDGYSYGNIAPYIAMYGLWYGEHFVWFDTSNMYEMTEYDDHIDISVLDNPYFPNAIDGSSIECAFVHYIAGELYYLREYNYYKLVNGSWTVISDFNPWSFYFSYRAGTGVIYDDYLMIGFEQSYIEGTTTLLNMSDTVKVTYWTDPKQVSVDLFSNQTISGQKTFKDTVITSQVNINDVYTSGGSTSITLGNNTTSANSMKFTVPGGFTVNSKNIATTDDCIMNRTILPYGSRVVNVYDNLSYEPYSSYYFVTNTGRMFYTNGGDYEFDGTQWNSVSPILGGSMVLSDFIVIAGSKTFYVNGQTYLWDDTTSVFTEIVSIAPSNRWNIWPCGDGVLRAGGAYKLISRENDTWSWIEDTVPDYKYGMTYYIDGNVYVLCTSDSKVYQYNESTKTYTELGTWYNWTESSFVCGGDIIFPYNGDAYYKIDLTKVGSEQNICTLTDIPYTNHGHFYGEYNNYLYYCPQYGHMNYCYGIEEELPEVPASNGTYVLKAVRTNSGITYSWVAEV